MFMTITHQTFIDPVRGAESGTSLPAHDRKSPTRRGEQK